MSALTFRTSTALLGLSTLLLTALAQAQPAQSEVAPTTAAPAESAPAAEANAQPAAPAPVAAASQEAAPPKVSFTEPPAAQAAPASPPPRPAAAPDDGPQTLFRSGGKLGGYGGLDVGYTRVAGNDAALLCGGGALLIDRALTIGLMGCGVAARINAETYGNVVHEDGDRLEFGYGGVLVGYQFFQKQLYNLSLTTMVGAGGTSIVNHRGTEWGDDDFDNHRDVKATDALFVAEPRLTGYLNLTRWARVGAFAGYRFVGGVNMRNLSAGDLSGPVVGGTVQFGWF